MYTYIINTTFELNTRDGNDMVDDFFNRLGAAHSSKLRHIDISTNLEWEGMLWHERLPAILKAVIANCTEDNRETLDTNKYFVEKAPFSFNFPISKPAKQQNWYRGQSKLTAAHELFTISIRGLSAPRTVNFKVAVPYAIFLFASYSRY